MLGNAFESRTGYSSNIAQNPNETRGFGCGSQGDDEAREHRPGHRHSVTTRPTQPRQWLLAFAAVALIIAAAGLIQPRIATARPMWESATASYYTLYGNRTSCGKTAGPTAWFVASLKPDTANCGRRITICHRRRCVRTTVQDRGAWRSDNRRWDLQVRVKRALHCSDLCRVSWKRGWK